MKKQEHGSAWMNNYIHQQNLQKLPEHGYLTITFPREKRSLPDAFKLLAKLLAGFGIRLEINIAEHDFLMAYTLPGKADQPHYVGILSSICRDKAIFFYYPRVHYRYQPENCLALLWRNQFKPLN